MADTTGIEWCDSTFNPWIGCAKVSPGCDNCYAEVSTPSRTMGIVWGATAERHKTSAGNWAQPIKWNRDAEEFKAKHGRRRRVFCASLSDVFDNAVPDQWRVELFALIRMTPDIDWLLLTKRIGNVGKMIPVDFDSEIYSNVWLGISVVNQEEADRDIPKLLSIDVALRWLSMEPLLGPVDIFRWLYPTGVTCMDVCPDAHYVARSEIETVKGSQNEVCPICPNCGLVAQWTGYDLGIDWVIVGGESGHAARPMHPNWVRSLRDQCQEASVPFLFKQWGEWAPHEARAGGDEGADLRSGRVRYLIGDGREFDGHFRKGDAAVAKVGKKIAGRMLDGKQWTEYPDLAKYYIF
jgi:protein gp37